MNIQMLKDYFQEFIDGKQHKIMFLNRKKDMFEEFKVIDAINLLEDKDKEIEKLNNIIKELDKQNGELGAELSIIKDTIDKTNWWLEQMLKQATNNETKAIINGALELLLDKGE